jgi:osmotically-inducible protein OsmY
MKNDTDLRNDVAAELAWDPSVHAKDIGVVVREGIVTLSGSVFTFSEKLAAERAVRRIAGVRGTVEKMTVNLLGTHQRNDDEIARAIATGLDWSTQVPKGAVTCLVENGGVVLMGTVDWNFQREAAYKAARHIHGVRAVRNQILIRPPTANATDIHSKITGALQRIFTQDSAGIFIETLDGTVTLTGKVHSWAEHDQAAAAAWSAPGVTSVDNKLFVFD